MLTRSANLDQLFLFEIMPFLGVFILKLAIFANIYARATRVIMAQEINLSEAKQTVI